MNKEQLDVIKERVSRFNEEKSSVVEAEIAIAITEYDVPALIAEVERLQRYETKVDKIHDAITRMENQEIDGFDFGEEVLEILGRAW